MQHSKVQLHNCMLHPPLREQEPCENHHITYRKLQSTRVCAWDDSLLIFIGCSMTASHMFGCCAAVAGTVVTMEVEYTNTGNVHLKDATLSVNDITDLACKSGLSAIANSDVYSSGAAVDLMSAVQVDVATKLVCKGTFDFTQDVLDSNTQSSKLFTPTATASNQDLSLTVTIPTGYSANVDVTIVAAPALTISLDPNNCTKPSIIPDSETSELSLSFCPALDAAESTLVAQTSTPARMCVCVLQAMDSVLTALACMPTGYE